MEDLLVVHNPEKALEVSSCHTSQQDWVILACAISQLAVRLRDREHIGEYARVFGKAQAMYPEKRPFNLCHRPLVDRHECPGGDRRSLGKHADHQE